MNPLLLIAAAGLSLAACANPNRPTDTGSMAQPAPAAGSGVSVPGSTARDTGSMQPVAGGAGVAVPAPTATDTGSMSTPTQGAGSSGLTRPRSTTTTRQ